MSKEEVLPSSITSLFKAIQEKDPKLLEKGFALDAMLVDEATSFKGRDAIAVWGADALIAHNTTISVQKVTYRKDDKWLVEVIMDGEFKESHGITDPFTLYMTFTINSSLLIQSLDITDLDPSMPSMFAVWAPKGNFNDPLSSIRLGKRPVPIAPKGWVKVRVSAAGINWHDLFSLKGVSPNPLHPLTFPLTIGCEATGTLEDGTPVLLYPVMTTQDAIPYNYTDITLDPGRHFISEQIQGTLASYVIVPAENTIPRPPNLSPNSAAVLGVSWLTAYRMLFTHSGLRPGNRMLVQGSSGGVSTALIQLGAAAGMRVWSTGRSVAKRKLALTLGAERVFAPGEQLPDSVDAVFDVSGRETWAHSLRSVRAGGTIVTSGVHGGEIVEMDLLRLVVEQINVKGVYVGTRREFLDLIEFVCMKEIVPHIGRVIQAETADEGLRDLLEGNTLGKIVVTF